jgi:DUF4097 and DUF4098 domain-containing protein YvlB
MTTMQTRISSFALLALFAIALPAAAQSKHKSKHGNRDDDGVSRIDTTVSVGRGATVEVSLISGDIKITSWDRPQVQIHATSESGDIRFDASSQRVTLEIERQDGDYDDDTHFEVMVPRDARVSASSISGDVSVKGAGELEATSVSGDVSASGVTGRASLQSVSGGVTASDLGGGAKVSAVSGDIELNGVSGDLQVSTVSGEMKLRAIKSAYVKTQTVSGDLEFDGTVDPKGRYEFNSHSGSFTLALPRGVGATVSMRGYSGDFNSSCAMTLMPGGSTGEGRNKNMTFQIGGGGARFSIETFSGDVTITGCGGSKSKED